MYFQNKTLYKGGVIEGTRVIESLRERLRERWKESLRESLRERWKESLTERMRKFK